MLLVSLGYNIDIGASSLGMR